MRSAVDLTVRPPTPSRRPLDRVVAFAERMADIPRRVAAFVIGHAGPDPLHECEACAHILPSARARFHAGESVPVVYADARGHIHYAVAKAGQLSVPATAVAIAGTRRGERIVPLLGVARERVTTTGVPLRLLPGRDVPVPPAPALRAD